jgi:hypothetical protein
MYKNNQYVSKKGANHRECSIFHFVKRVHSSDSRVRFLTYPPPPYQKVSACKQECVGGNGAYVLLDVKCSNIPPNVHRGQILKIWPGVYFDPPNVKYTPS